MRTRAALSGLLDARNMWGRATGHAKFANKLACQPATTPLIRPLAQRPVAMTDATERKNRGNPPMRP